MDFGIGLEKFVDREDIVENLPKENIHTMFRYSFRIIFGYEDIDDLFFLNSGILHLWFIEQMENHKPIKLNDVWSAKQLSCVKEVKRNSLHYLPMVSFMFSNEDDLKTFKEDLTLFKLSQDS